MLCGFLGLFESSVFLVIFFYAGVGTLQCNGTHYNLNAYLPVMFGTLTLEIHGSALLQVVLSP